MGERRITLSERQLTLMMKAAAAEGVREAFLTIGVDISTPQGVIQAQRDWDHLRGWRKASDAFKKGLVSRAAATVWTLVLGGLGLSVAFWQGMFSR